MGAPAKGAAETTVGKAQSAAQPVLAGAFFLFARFFPFLPVTAMGRSPLICHGSLAEWTAVPGIWRLAAFLEGPQSGTEVWCRFGLQSPCEDAVFSPRWKNASI